MALGLERDYHYFLRIFQLFLSRNGVELNRWHQFKAAGIDKGDEDDGFGGILRTVLKQFLIDAVA